MGFPAIMRAPLLVLIAGLSLLGCATPPSSLDNCDTLVCLQERQKNHLVRHIDFWQPMFDKPLEQRVQAAPVELVDYISLDNRVNGFPDGIRSAEDSAEFVTLVRKALSGLPTAVRELFIDRLMGVYIVDDLGSTGFSDNIYDRAGNPVAGFIVLDAGYLQKKANAWASWKDSTIYKPDGDYEIRTTIELAENDTKVNAVQFILLHELAHVLAIGNRFHPNWNLANAVSLDGYPFSQFSWELTADKQGYRSRFDDIFPLRQSIFYYRQPKLEAAQLIPVLKTIEQTNFISLYATTGIFDDFAESFAVYIHSELMNKPYRVEVLKAGQLVYSMGSCLQSRCRDKFEFFNRLFSLN